MPVAAPAAHAGLERIADVPIYAADSLVRRASSLQLTADARPPVAALPAALWQQLAQMGLPGLTVPEEFGGLGMSELDFVLLEGRTEIAAQTEITVLGKISGDGCGPATVDGDDDACSDRRRRCAIAPSNQARCCRGYCAAILDQLFPRRRSLVFAVRHRIRFLRKWRG